MSNPALKVVDGYTEFMARTFAYSVLDVFAEHALEGNPLAVFHDARGLSDAEMQSLAREKNLAETTFILPSGDPEEERRSGIRVRIFTTQEELPLAGHPTLGTASWLHLHHPALRGAETVTLQLNVGAIPVRFTPEAGPGVVATMRQNNPEFGKTYARAEIADAIGVEESDIDATHLPQTVSTGMPFCIVLLRSLDVAAKLQIDQRKATAWLQKNDAKFFYCIAPLGAKSAQDAAFHARMQFYHGEDPATGSAAGCAISWLVARGLVQQDVSVVIEQGVEILRPSRITAAASIQNGKVCDVRVSGRTIPVASGSFFLL
jgi:trans-2,3-dihydro-3-hydroxyanthranilate isomerase